MGMIESINASGSGLIRLFEEYWYFIIIIAIIVILWLIGFFRMFGVNI